LHSVHPQHALQQLMEAEPGGPAAPAPPPTISLLANLPSRSTAFSQLGSADTRPAQVMGSAAAAALTTGLL